MNIVQTIRDETRDHRNSIAIIDGDRRITYGELLEQIAQLKQILAGRGIGVGQRIAFHCGDGIDYVIGSLALLDCGAAVVPTADNITDQEVQETIDRIDVQGVLIHAKIKRASGEQSAEKLSEVFSFQARVATGEADALCREMGAAFIRFTSGTTGESKGVVLSHQSIIDRTDAADQGLAITHDDVILWVLAMSYHFVVSILLFLRRGATIVVANQFFPFSLLQAASKHPVSFIYASPVHYHLLGMSNAVEPTALAKVRLAISTSMKMPVDVSLAFSKKFGFAPAEAYGIIEIGLPFINTEPRSTPISSVGQVLPDYQLQIRNPDGDGIGEVLIKGKGMFDAYFSPWRARADCTDDGWFHTGDLGKVDEMGRLFLLGRSKTVLVCAGMKVFPEEVEQVINTMSGVKESMVLGREHPQFGQVPVARVVVEGDASRVIADLRRFCCQKLSAYKVPVEFVQVESLPKTASGKIARAVGMSPSK
jgi:long-chain acyl-CoA synthetase